MKRFTVKNSNLIALLLLLAFALIFFHSNDGKTSEESKESHAQHDFSNLVSKTLQPTQDNLPEFEVQAIVSTFTEDFHVHKTVACWIELVAPLYSKDTSLILLFSTLLI